MDSSLILNIDNHQKRFVRSAKEDRINNLPNNLIDSILERLPVQDAVRTSILSRNWRYRWTTMRSLVLDKHISEKLAKNGAFGRNGFIRIVNQIFNYLKGPILKLHLHIPNMFLDSFQEVDQWILSLSREGVKELVLTNSNQLYQLPSHLFHCVELRKLELNNCLFKPPLEFQGYLHLKRLFLINIEFGANLYGTVINLPQLEQLLLLSCTNVYNFNIKSTKLKILRVIADPYVMIPQLLYNPWLSVVVVIAITKPILQVEKINLATILSNLPYLVSFSTNGYFLKFAIEEKFPKWLPKTANRLMNLRLTHIVFGDLDQLQGVLCMLRNSPNIEVLSVSSQTGFDGLNSDEKPAVCYLEASDCLEQTLYQMKTIHILYVEESRPLLLFIKLLLDHSPNLEKMSIRPNVTVDAHKRLNFAKAVMQFPRASSKAEVLYLDPYPQSHKNN